MKTLQPEGKPSQAQLGRAGRDERDERLEDLRLRIKACSVCRDPQRPVPGVGLVKVAGAGPAGAPLMLIGEAPGAKEEKFGRPFVGRAGQFLREALNDLGLEPEKEVYLTNLVRCRVYRLGPTGRKRNVTPSRELQEHGLVHLREEIALVGPGVIGLLGNIAAKHFLPAEFVLSRDRGRIFVWQGIKVVATYHPSAVLRNPAPLNREIRHRFLADLRLMAEVAGKTGRSPQAGRRQVPRS